MSSPTGLSPAPVRPLRGRDAVRWRTYAQAVVHTRRTTKSQVVALTSHSLDQARLEPKQFPTPESDTTTVNNPGQLNLFDPAPYTEPLMLYVAARGDRIKIGVSRNPEADAKQLQLQLLWTTAIGEGSIAS